MGSMLFWVFLLEFCGRFIGIDTNISFRLDFGYAFVRFAMVIDIKTIFLKGDVVVVFFEFFIA